MKFLENIKTALLSIWSNKFRSFLTVLGIIVGVFSVVLLMALGRGAKDQIADQFTDLGTNLIFVVPGKVDPSKPTTFNPATSIGTNTLTTKDVSDIKTVTGVKYVAPIDVIGGQIKYNSKVSLQSFALALWPEYFSIRNIELTSGRLFTQEEMEHKDPVCVLGEKSKEDLFGNEDAVNKKILIRGKELTVIGVLGKSPVAFRLFGFDFDSIVYIPFTLAKDISGTSNIFRILIQLENKGETDKVISGIKAAVLKNHQGTEDFTVLKQEDILKILDSVLDILTILIVAIAAISLVVGGIGIMNIMLVSVTERTKEIGLRKAVGATRGNILTQFLTESILLSFLGGIIGVLGAEVFSILITKIIKFTPVISLRAVLLALGVAFGVGVIFGTIPALKAARLDPIDALRHE